MNKTGLAALAALLGAGLITTKTFRSSYASETFMAQGRKRAVALRANRVNGGISDLDPNIVGPQEFAQKWYKRLNKEAEKVKAKNKLGRRYRNLFQEAVNQLPTDEKGTVRRLEEEDRNYGFFQFGQNFYPRIVQEYTNYLQDKYRGMLKPYEKMMQKHYEKIKTFYAPVNNKWWDRQEVRDELEKIYTLIGKLLNRLPDEMRLGVLSPFYGYNGNRRFIAVNSDSRQRYSQPFGQGGYDTIKKTLEIRSYDSGHYKRAMQRIEENKKAWLEVRSNILASERFPSFETDESEMKAFANWLLDNDSNLYYRILNYNIFFKKNPSIKWVAWDSQKYDSKYYDGDISDMNIYQRIKSENVTFGKAFDTALIDKCFSLSAYKTNQRQFKQKANALIPKIVSLMSAGEKKEEDLEKQAYDFNRPKIISLLNSNFAKYKNPVSAADDKKLQRITRMVQGESFYPSFLAKGNFKRVIRDKNGEYKLEDVDEMRIDSSALIKHKITMDDMSFPQSLVDDAKQQIRQKLRDGKESNNRNIERIKTQLKQAREGKANFEKKYKGYIDRLNGL